MLPPSRATVFAHGHGFASDHHEDGVDLNLEVHFAPLNGFGSPRPLHKDPVGCERGSGCGFGIRVMPRLGIELAVRTGPSTSLSLLYDHMSHKAMIGGENEGIDPIGVRLQRAF